MEANRRGGSDKYSGFGTDRSELLPAEALANPRWLADEPSTAALRERIVAACRDSRSQAAELMEKSGVEQMVVALVAALAIGGAAGATVALGWAPPVLAIVVATAAGLTAGLRIRHIRKGARP